MKLKFRNFIFYLLGLLCGNWKFVFVDIDNELGKFLKLCMYIYIF